MFILINIICFLNTYFVFHLIRMDAVDLYQLSESADSKTWQSARRYSSFVSKIIPYIFDACIIIMQLDNQKCVTCNPSRVTLSYTKLNIQIFK